MYLRPGPDPAGAGRPRPGRRWPRGPVTIGGQYFGIHFVALSAMATPDRPVARSCSACWRRSPSRSTSPTLNGRGRALAEARPAAGMAGRYRQACSLSSRLVADALLAFKWLFVGGPMEQSVHLIFAITTACVAGVLMVLSGFVLKLLLDNLDADRAIELPLNGQRTVHRKAVSLGHHAGPRRRGMDIRDPGVARRRADHGLEIIVVDSSPSTAPPQRSSKQLRRPTAAPTGRAPRPRALADEDELRRRNASGDHVCILHQDDLWLPGRVEAIRRWIEKSRNAALHLAPTLIIDRHGRQMGRWNCPLPAERTFLNPSSCLSGCSCRISSRSPRRSSGEARGWRAAPWTRPCGTRRTGTSGPSSRSGSVMYHDEITTAFRVHGSSLTVTGSRDAVEFRAQMETVLNRYLEAHPGRRPRKRRATCSGVD